MRADSLTELDLSGKGIGPEGGMVVAGLVPVMTSLTSLDVRWNEMGKNGKAALQEAVKGRDGFSLRL